MNNLKQLTIYALAIATVVCGVWLAFHGQLLEGGGLVCIGLAVGVSQL